MEQLHASAHPSQRRVVDLLELTTGGVQAANALQPDRNYNGISLRQDDRGTGLHCPRIVQNVKVHDNQVVMARGSSGLSLTSGDTSWFTARNNHFSGNDYTLIDGTQRFAWMGQILDPSRWRAYGQDTDGTFRSG